MAARDDVVEMPIKELVIERVFDAPRERIFDVFTQPEHLQKWWGPKMVGIHFADADRRRVAPPAGTGLPANWNDDIVTLVTFSSEGRRTRMTIRTLSGFTAEWGEKARFGWAQSLDKLEHALKV